MVCTKQVSKRHINASIAGFSYVQTFSKDGFHEKNLEINSRKRYYLTTGGCADV